MSDGRGREPDALKKAPERRFRHAARTVLVLSVALAAALSAIFLVFPGAYLHGESLGPGARQAPLPAALPVKKAVLLLFPFRADLPSSVLATKAIREELEGAGGFSFDIYSEYLDLDRFPGDAWVGKMMDLFAFKYRDRKISLVLVAGETLLDLWMDHRSEVLPGVPVVFYDTLGEHLAGKHFPHDVTGISGRVDYLRSLEWMARALPGVKEIVTVHGTGKADGEFLSSLADLPARVASSPELAGRLKVTDLSSLPLPQIKTRTAHLPKSSVVLYGLMFEDAAGTRYRPIDALRELAAASAVPVISGYDQFVGTGSIGGYMYSIDSQARKAVRVGLRILNSVTKLGETARLPLAIEGSSDEDGTGMALTKLRNTERILKGKAICPISITLDESDRFMFDHQALQRFNIPLAILPPGSIVMNRQYTDWERYSGTIMAAAALIVLLLLLLAFLLVLMGRLRRAHLDLNSLNADLEAQVTDRTAALNRLNTDLESAIAVHREDERALRKSGNQLRFISDNIPAVMTYISATDMEYRYVNRGFSSIFDLEPQETFGRKIREILGEEIFAAVLPYFERARAGETLEYEIVLPVHGEDRWFNIHYTPEFNDQGSVENLITLWVDITAVKRTAELLAKVSKVNRDLLAELQHRVKNSFNMILSMFSLTGEGRSEETNAAIEDLGARVASVSRLYSLLYSSGSFSEVQLDVYCALVASPLAGLAENVALLSEMESITVPVKTAAPIGLILTELVTNALKHAFPGGRPGIITLSLRRTAGGAVLQVRDDGAGLPAGFDLSAPASAGSGSGSGMGFTLVRGLASQIGGTFLLENADTGTLSTLAFPVPVMEGK